MVHVISAVLYLEKNFGVRGNSRGSGAYSSRRVMHVSPKQVKMYITIHDKKLLNKCVSECIHIYVYILHIRSLLFTKPLN